MKAQDELLEWARHNNPDLYDRVMAEKYIEENGYHFNEKYAMEAVEKMHSSMGRGQHWTFEEVVNAIEPFTNIMGDDDTCWDAYVVLHSWWHDLGQFYETRTGGELFRDALTWAFADDDAPDGKVWKYINAMK